LVTGVFKSLPVTSHLVVNHLASYSTLSSIVRSDGDTSNATETSFGWYDFYTYLQLQPGTDIKKLESKFPAFCDRYINSREWSKKNNVRNDIYLMPLEDIHLSSNYNQEAESNGNGQAVSFLFMIAFIIIIIAWVNYINLATARSMERAKEVGVRKVMGALRANLIKQFLVESFLLNIAALILAIAIIYLVYPSFSQLSGHDPNQGFSLSTKYWAIFASIFLGGSLLSGIYPALCYLRTNPF
jgi:putative ABC transport system permease protein